MDNTSVVPLPRYGILADVANSAVGVSGDGNSECWVVGFVYKYQKDALEGRNVVQCIVDVRAMPEPDTWRHFVFPSFWLRNLRIGMIPTDMPVRVDDRNFVGGVDRPSAEAYLAQWKGEVIEACGPSMIVE